MGRRSIIIGVLAACLIAFSSVAFAWIIPEATIVSVGPAYNAIRVFVKGAPLTGTVQFYLSPNRENEQLAVLLTALSLEKTVWMKTAADTPGSYVTVVYINE